LRNPVPDDLGGLPGVDIENAVCERTSCSASNEEAGTIAGEPAPMETSSRRRFVVLPCELSSTSGVADPVDILAERRLPSFGAGTVVFTKGGICINGGAGCGAAAVTGARSNPLRFLVISRALDFNQLALKLLFK